MVSSPALNAFGEDEIVHDVDMAMRVVEGRKQREEVAHIPPYKWLAEFGGVDWEFACRSCSRCWTVQMAFPLAAHSHFRTSAKSEKRKGCGGRGRRHGRGHGPSLGWSSVWSWTCSQRV